jgi:hypothetical protein
MMTGSSRDRQGPAPDWVVCLGVFREVTDEMVACPLGAGGLTRFEDCLDCHHLAVLADDRERESCSTGDPIS